MTLLLTVLNKLSISSWLKFALGEQALQKSLRISSKTLPSSTHIALKDLLQKVLFKIENSFHEIQNYLIFNGKKKTTTLNLRDQKRKKNCVRCIPCNTDPHIIIAPLILLLQVLSC